MLDPECPMTYWNGVARSLAELASKSQLDTLLSELEGMPLTEDMVDALITECSQHYDRVAHAARGGASAAA